LFFPEKATEALQKRAWGFKGHDQSQAGSQAVLKNVNPVRGGSFPLTCTFKGNEFTYDVQTKDETFARKLAAAFSKKVGSSLEELGDLDIDF
jgi:hypothetical protein